MKNLKNHVFGGRMVKWKGRVASIAPALASVSVVALMSTGALADTVSGVLFEPHVVAADENVTVTSDGRIFDTLDNDATFMLDMLTGADFTSDITNAGRIVATETDVTTLIGIYVDNSLSGSIVNSGDIILDISNSNTQASATGIWVDGDLSGSITNTASGVIDVNVFSTSSTASAYGIYTDAVTGSITNAGTITVSAETTNDSSASAWGIYANGNVDGSITNTATGVITATASSVSDTASAVGIYVDLDLNGTITNAGRIVATATADATDSDASAYGIYVSGVITGSITNTASGVITATAIANSSDATAYGIFGDDTLSGSITNAGAIVATATSTSDSAQANGIYVYYDMDGSISNTGSITATAVGSSTASAFGIRLNEDLNGTVSNAGTITVDANSYDDTALAYGVYVSGDVNESGVIANTGSITVTSRSYTSTDYAYGIYVGGDMAGTINNSGDIFALARSGTESYAYAYGVDVDGNLSGSLTNSGTIEAAAHNEDSSAYAYGVAVTDGGFVDGTITNTVSGIIRAVAQSVTDFASAIGIYAGDDVGTDGVIRNAGLIEALSESTDANAEATGIDVASVLGGLIDNSGQVTVSATTNGTNDLATAYGIYVSDDVNATGAIQNSGTISVTGVGDDDASVWGIYASSTIDGTINNSGVITATATANGTVSDSATGIETGAVNGTVSNSGTITATATNTNEEAYAEGIYVSSVEADGTLSNSGVITVTATGERETSAYGLEVGGTTYGAISNSGSLNVTATASIGDALSWGVLAGDYLDSDGSITNDGSITVSANAIIDSAFGAGINISGPASGQVVNNNLIDVTATGGDGGGDVAAAYGIVGQDDDTMPGFGTADLFGQPVYGDITNAGTIRVAANVDGEAATAAGIYVDGGLGGTVTNSGLIDAAATNIDTGSASARAYGIYINTSSPDAYVENSGTILASASADNSYAAGVYLDNYLGDFLNTGKIVVADELNDDAVYLSFSGLNGGLATLSTSGFIEGRISINGSSNLDIRFDKGMSVHWTASDATPTDDLGLLGIDVIGENTINPDGVAVLSRDIEGAAPEFATLDSSGIVANRQVAADSAFAGMGAMVANTAGGNGVPAQVTSGPSGDAGFKPFIVASGSNMTYAGDYKTLDQSVNSRAITVGGTKSSDSGLSLGIAAGTSDGETKVQGQWTTASESTSNGAFAGVSVADTLGAITVSGGLTAGSLSFDNTRYVNDNTVDGGIATQNAAYDSTYMGMQIGLTGRFTVGDGLSLLPSAAMRYTNNNTSGYTEDGVDGAVVDASNHGVAEGEIGLTLEKATDKGTFSFGISQVSRSLSGDTGVGVAMIDDALTVDAGLPDATATKLSIGFNAGSVGAAQFNLGAETLVGSGGVSGSKVGGTISFKF